jgi:hypothetical protein
VYTRDGIVQKLSDAHADVFKPTGSVAACRDKTDTVWETLLDGDWSASRTASPLKKLVIEAGYVECLTVHAPVPHDALRSRPCLVCMILRMTTTMMARPSRLLS